MTVITSFSKSLLLLVMVFSLYSCFTGKEVVLSDRLKSGAERWVAKTTGTLGVGRTAFGPYTQSPAIKIDSPKLKSSPKFFKVSIFSYEDSTKKRLVYAFDVQKDILKATVLVNLWMVSKESNPGLFSKRDVETRSEKKNATGEVQLENDSSSWAFEVGPYSGGIPNQDDVYLKTVGIIKNHSSVFNIEPVTEFTDGKPGAYGFITKGIVVKDPAGEEVAALQLRGKNYVWMKKDLDPRQKMVIASVFATLLSTRGK